MAVPSTPTLAERIAEEALSRAVGDFSPEALAEVGNRIVDTLGVGFAGAVTPPGRAAAALATPLADGAPGCLVWASGARAALGDAVFANAAAAHALDYDDSIGRSVTHTGPVAVSIGLALSELDRPSGRELLAAIACGYQVADFVGRIAQQEFQPNGFQSAAIGGLFGGVTTAARLMGLSAAALADAYGIAGSMAAGLMEFLIVGGDTKPLQVGWAARGAVTAAALARAGMAGPRTVFEGRYGLYRSYIRKELDEQVVRDEPLWDGESVLRVSTKPYPVCQGIHASADAWTEIARSLRAAGVDPAEDVGELHCEVPPFAARLVLDPLERKRRPQTAHEGRFSLPYCLARIALDGSLGLASFSAERLADRRAHAFAEKVTYSLLPDGDDRASEVRATSASAGVLSRTVRRPSGPPHRWVTPEALRDKYLEAGAAVASRPALEAVWEAAQAIGASDDVAPLLAELAAAAGTRPHDARAHEARAHEARGNDARKRDTGAHDTRETGAGDA